MALALATLPSILVWPSLFSAPIAIYLAIRHWSAPPSILPRTRIRYYLAILFAALHIQYAISFATLEVFVLGIGLGWLRVRSGSTLTCMVTHAGYDIAVGFLSLIAK